MKMILPKSALLALLLSSPPAAAYFAQVNNAHVEFAASGATGDAQNGAVEPKIMGLFETLQAALEGAPEIAGLFEEWAERFGREYETLEEKSKRILIWLENHALIETHNAKKESSFTLGHNEFSDLSHAEFLARMHLDGSTPSIAGKKEFNFMEHDEPSKEAANSRLRGASEAAAQRRLEDEGDAKDWHGMGLMGPVRNQGACGACWAFSAIGSIESGMGIDKYNKMTPNERAELSATESGGGGVSVGNDLGLVVPLSEQDMIDCDTLQEKGCQGGLMITAFNEEEVKTGLCSEVDYPYVATQGTCSRDTCTPVPGSVVRDHVDVEPRKNNALKEALKVKPVTAAMVASDPMFQFYSSGIYSAEGCGRVTKEMGEEGCNVLYEDQDTCLPDINHGVLVVGYGTDESATTDVQTFFKVKNSWGKGWGEGGYFRIARYEEDPADPMDSWGECAILTLLSYPVME